MKRGLVLGGGGLVAIAWETGVIQGLLEGGIEVRKVDVVVGTSAGSMVGARIAAGQNLAEPTPRPAAGTPRPNIYPPQGADMSMFEEAYKLWYSAQVMTPELGIRIGALARKAPTAEEAVFVEATGGSVGMSDWPSTLLKIPAVDCDSGEHTVFDRDSGVPLDHAIAASCCIPGLFPVVHINGHAYIDGGIGSDTHAHLALSVKPEVVLVISPVVKETALFGALAERYLHEELDTLRKSGVHVIHISPNAADIETMGTNGMDRRRAKPVAAAGVERGRELGKTEAKRWNG
jgi:NTE family protein